MINKEEILNWFKLEVRDRMNSLGLHPYDMPAKCHMTYENVLNCIGGRSFPNLWSLVLMAERLECTVNDLLGYEEIDDLGVLERPLASKEYRNAVEFSHCFTERIMRYLSDAGISIEEISERTGFKPITVKRWICDIGHLPKTMQFLQICSALNCTPSELLGY